MADIYIYIYIYIFFFVYIYIYIYIYIPESAPAAGGWPNRVPFRERMRGGESERGRKTTSLGERPRQVPPILAPFFDFSRPGMVKNHSVY